MVEIIQLEQPNKTIGEKLYHFNFTKQEILTYPPETILQIIEATSQIEAMNASKWWYRYSYWTHSTLRRSLLNLSILIALLIPIGLIDILLQLPRLVFVPLLCTPIFLWLWLSGYACDNHLAARKLALKQVFGGETK